VHRVRARAAGPQTVLPALLVVFGLAEKTAIRYATAAKALLATPLERDTSGSP